MSEDARLADCAAGMDLARRAIIAIAEGDDTAALALLNGADSAEIRWAAGCLLAALKESISAQVKHDPRRLELALKAGAEGIVQDTVVTQVALIVQNEADRL